MNTYLPQKRIEDVEYWCEQFHLSQFSDIDCAIYMYVHCILLLNEIGESVVDDFPMT